ncbi:MAG: FG-GAP-like repeat-containing protein [Bacteroidales bacterium]
MKRFIFLIMTSLLPGLSCYSDIQLKEHMVRQNVGGACAITAADFDLDGDVDLALTVSGAGSLIWMQNDGHQNFTEISIKEGFTGARSIYGVDLDLDGDTDLVATAFGLNKFAWFENDGHGVFTERPVAENWTGASWVIAGDVDLDGDIDIVGVACDMNQIGWFENDGQNNFTEHIIKAGWTKVNGCTLSDFDQDGDMDIIATAKSGDIIIFQNGGQSSFTEIPVCINWGSPNSVRAGDLDGDQDIDLVATSCNNGNEVAWFENLGDCRFVRHKMKDKYNGARQCEITDIDQDGDLDILSIAWISSVVTLFENRGSGRFREYEFCSDAYDMLKLYIADIDGDSDLDIAGACFGDGQIRWWENVDEFMVAGVSSENRSGHYPLEVSFLDNSSARPGVTSWEWDFDGDGIVDSFEENPVHVFNNPGYYPVNLTVSNKNTSQSINIEDFIRVFDGKSALEFDNPSGFLDVSPIKQTSLAEEFSFECWVKPLGFGESNSGHIWQKDRIKLFVYQSGILLPNEACFTLFMTHADGTISKVCSPSNSVTIGEWQHLSVTYDAAESLATIYKNGVRQELTVVTEPSGALNDPGEKSMVIGNVDRRNRAFKGIIDEVRIWNRCLSQTEVESNTYRIPVGDEPGLIGSFRLDEGTGETLYDPTGKNSVAIFSVRWAQGKDMNTSGKSSRNLLPSLSVTAYPNPSRGECFLRICGAYSDDLSVEVVDINGRICYSSIFHETKSSDGEINIRLQWNSQDGVHLSPGLFFMRVRTKDELIIEKVLVN